MPTLQNTTEVKEYILTNIKANLPKININTLQTLLEKLSLNVYANSKNSYLNSKFNSLINILIKIKSQDVISIYDVSEFFYYYEKLLKEINISFISSL